MTQPKYEIIDSYSYWMDREGKFHREINGVLEEDIEPNPVLRSLLGMYLEATTALEDQ